MLIQEIKGKSYILSGKKVFFHRYCDSGFKTKWTGLWSSSRKFLDYFSFKINEEWLSPENCVEFYYNDYSSSHIYSLEKMKVIENLFVQEDLKALTCKLTLEARENAEGKIFLEIGANIREREENWHDREYRVEKKENVFLISSQKGCLAISFSPTFSLLEKPTYKDHFPGELQRCFTPGYFVKDFQLSEKQKEEITAIFACGENEAEAVLNLIKTKNLLEEKVEAERVLPLGSEIKTNFSEISEIFNKSVIGLEKLKVEAKAGFGYVAGYPWFIQFWGRDLGWMLPAVIDYGNFEDARKCLETLMKFQSREGEIPNFISLEGKPSFGSIDATPLWILSMYHYIKNSGDLEFLKSSRQNLIKAFEWCVSKSDEKFLEAGKRETWMDSLDRDGKPVEVQAIWYSSLKALKKLFEILNEDILEEKEVEDLGKKIEEEFWNPSTQFYFDRIKWKFKDERKTVNAIFPIYFKISKNPIKVLERLESEEFTSPFGVRTISKNDEIFNPLGYHTGSVWSWITALLACVEFDHGREEKGLEYLRILRKMFDKNCIGSLDEAWNSENGDAILLKEIGYEPSGFYQGWGYALIVRCVDEHILGLNIDALNKTIYASPSLPDGMKIWRRKRIGNDLVEIEMERKGEELKLNLKSGRGKGYRLVKIPKV
ncbi:MAG: amylo-alpha-1,6-glucosidase [Candidatus Aenigmatarchaeota archaeon]